MFIHILSHVFSEFIHVFSEFIPRFSINTNPRLFPVAPLLLFRMFPNCLTYHIELLIDGCFAGYKNILIGNQSWPCLRTHNHHKS